MNTFESILSINVCYNVYSGLETWQGVMAVSVEEVAPHADIKGPSEGNKNTTIPFFMGLYTN